MRKDSRPIMDKVPNWAAFCFFAFLITIFYFRVLFENQVFVFVDASRFFYPLWKWGGEVLKQGWIPLWNPDTQFGTPYLADPQMAYAYPPVPLLYTFLSPMNAFAALIILHHFWAILGFWVFARKEGFPAKPSLMGCLIFGFSLHVVCSSWTPVALMTISWIPWLFWAAGKTYRGEKGGFLFLSIVWAMQFSAGYPVLTYLSALAVGLHFGWKTIAVWKESNLGWIFQFFLAGILAIIYNLVWGLPFLEMFRLSNYESGASHFHDLGWLDFATAFNPFDQGHPLLPHYHGPHYWVSTYFIGLPALALLIWGAVHRVYRKANWGLFIVFLVLSLGILGAGHLLKLVLPGYALVIHSGFWLSLLIFWAAWMAMESTEQFLAKALKPGKAVIWIGITGVIGGLSYLLGAPLDPATFWISLGLTVLTAIPGTPVVRSVFLAGALALSLGTAAFSLNILLDRSYYSQPPATLDLLPKPGRIFFTPPLLREATVLQGENMAQAYDSAKEKLYPNWPLIYGKEETPLYNTFQLKDSFAWTFQAFQYSLKHSSNVLDYLGIRYIFGKNRFKDFKKLSSADSPVEISENPTALPKWFSINQAFGAGPSLEDDFSKASRESLNYRKECFVADPSREGFYYSRQVTVQTHWPNRLALTAEPAGKGKALVVSSETDYPGWKAWVEGQARPVEMINHTFRGVLMEAGETRAVFRFEPHSFRLGLFFSLLVCGLWAMLILKRVTP